MRFYRHVPDLQVQRKLIRTIWEGLCAQRWLQQQLILDAFTEQLHGCFSIITGAKLQPTPLFLLSQVLHKHVLIMSNHSQLSLLSLISGMVSHRTTKRHTHMDTQMYCLFFRSRWKEKGHVHSLAKDKIECTRQSMGMEEEECHIMQMKNRKGKTTVKVFHHEQLMKWMKAAKMSSWIYIIMLPAGSACTVCVCVLFVCLCAFLCFGECLTCWER